MLVKNEKKFCDAHFHYADCLEQQCFSEASDFIWTGCSCAHSIEEWEIQEKNSNLVLAYGLHPQSAAFINIEENLNFLSELIENKKIQAIGETGFDFFTEEYKSTAAKQEIMFTEQIKLAQKNHLPVIIHCRKANEKLFAYSPELKELPSVLFHSFMGTPVEAQSLLNKGINGYFSFGKQLMNNNKKVIACVKELPLERLLCETDAPYQFLKGETKTYKDEIIKIYEAIYSLRREDEEIINNQIYENFNNMFNLS